MMLHFANPGLKFAIFISLFCHIFCFSSIEFTFGKNTDINNSDFSDVFFLGPILRKADHYSQSDLEADYTAGHAQRPKTLWRISRFNAIFFTPLERSALTRVSSITGLSQRSSPIYKTDQEFKKPFPSDLIDNKIVYFESHPAPKTKKSESSIMFYPPMPYHFLLYFKDRQTAHMEIAFDISPKGKVAGIKRKISSGNPELDLLVMRNLTHFINLCKSNFALGSSRVVKIDLSP